VKKIKLINKNASSIIDLLSLTKIILLSDQDNILNIQIMKEDYNIGMKQINSVYHLARLKFESGDYENALDDINKYRYIAQVKNNLSKSFSVLWGKLCIDIALNRWDSGMRDIGDLKEAIDTKFPALSSNSTTQKLWLLHWSLFIFPKKEGGYNDLIDLYMNDSYLNILLTTGQHLLRYLIFATLVTKNSKNFLINLISTLKKKKYNCLSKDPMANLVFCISVNLDFDNAFAIIKECKNLIENDFFLSLFKDNFFELVRVLVFETYFRFHLRINQSTIADKLSINQIVAERWLANVISMNSLHFNIESQPCQITKMTQNYLKVDSIIEKIMSILF